MMIARTICRMSQSCQAVGRVSARGLKPEIYTERGPQMDPVAVIKREPPVHRFDSAFTASREHPSCLYIRVFHIFKVPYCESYRCSPQMSSAHKFLCKISLHSDDV